MKKRGIALGGGGMRGFAHLGVMKALAEKGIEFDVYSGTSAGAIMAALMAAEIGPDESMDIMRDFSITDVAKVLLPVLGLASLDNLREKMDRILGGKNFSDLAHPLFLAVSNLNTGRVEYVHEGNVALAVQASSSIPILFRPVEMDGQLYVDGGLLDNVPVAPLVDLCEEIVAVNIMPLEKQEGIKGLTEVAVRTFQMSVSMQDEEKKNSALLIRIEGLSKFHILDSGHNEEIFDIGYNHVKELNISLPSLTAKNRKQGDQ